MAAATPLSEHVTEKLRTEILRGDYRAGERLPGERDLAHRLEVGRAVVREALRSLEQMGLVSVRRGGGATVRELEEASVEIVPHLLFAGGELDRELFSQLLDVQEMLVSGAARLAVERGREDDLVHAGELLERLSREALGAEERASVLDALLDVITRTSGNLVLKLCRRAVGPRWLRGLGRLGWGSDAATRGVDVDAIDAISRALEARDPIATEEAVRRLVRLRRERLLAALEDPKIAAGLASPAGIVS
ncbi:MAG: FadR/GntR family transcriptional regulator [Myxococcota bacterium]